MIVSPLLAAHSQPYETRTNDPSQAYQTFSCDYRQAQQAQH